MLIKTAFLLGSIGSGIHLLSHLYSFVEYGILSGSEYLTPRYYVQTSISIVAQILITTCFIMAYQKQNSKSWKD